MPTIDQLIQDNINRLETVPDEFVGTVQKAEMEVLRRINKLLPQLETDSRGLIMLSAKNITAIENIINDMRTVLFDGAYVKGVRTFAGQISEQASQNKEIFSKTFKEFSDKELYDTLTQESVKRAVRQLNDGAITQTFLNPLKNIMSESMATSNIVELSQQLSIEIAGTKEIDGKLLNYVKQTAYDTFAISDAEFLHKVSEDLGVEYYKYIGGKVADTRCFCDARNGKIFSKKQIEYWGRTPGLWDKKKKDDKCKGGGRMKGTNEANIFLYRGGYRCQHQLRPISEDAVPDEIKKNKDNVKYIPK